MREINVLSALIFSALGFGAQAGTIGEVCNKLHLETPCEHQGWSLGGQALYVRATSNIQEIPYAIYANNNSLNYGAANSWGWGFQLNGAYSFETGNDLALIGIGSITRIVRLILQAV